MQVACVTALIQTFTFTVAAMKPKEGEGAGGFRVEAARRDRAAASLAQIEEIDLAAGGLVLLCWAFFAAACYDRAAASLAQIEEIDLAAGGPLLLAVWCWAQVLKGWAAHRPR